MLKRAVYSVGVIDWGTPIALSGSLPSGTAAPKIFRRDFRTSASVRRLLIGLILVSLVGCFRVNPNLAGIGELVSRDWEYRYEVICHPASSSAQQMASAQSEMLSRLGNDRWELVGIQERPSTADQSETCWIFTLKRRNRNDN